MSDADPLAPTDPIAALPPAERVNYATGVMLAADDFLDEQSYHRARLATALKSIAGFGTLAGLRVHAPGADDAERELVVDAGVAVDRYGRLVELDEPWCIRISRWFLAQTDGALLAAVQADPSTVVVDVFLSALDCATAKTPAFATGPFDALNALVPARISETASLALVIRDEAGTPPAPRNFWPAADATDDEKLQAVLGSWNPGYAEDADAILDPLQEHVDGQDSSAIFLARATLPVTVPETPPGARPALDLTKPVSVDNGGRPFIFVPGKWLGTAFAAASLTDPA